MLAALRILIQNGSRKTKDRQRPIGQTVCKLTQNHSQNTKHLNQSSKQHPGDLNAYFPFLPHRNGRAATVTEMW